MDQTVLGVFAIKKEDAGPTDGLEHVEIIIKKVWKCFMTIVMLGMQSPSCLASCTQWI